MRKWMLCALSLLLAAVLLCGCAAALSVRPQEQTQLLFYYRAADGGAFVTQPAPSDMVLTPDAVLRAYLAGADAQTAVLPDGLSGGCTADGCKDGVLTLRLADAAPEGIGASVTAACLTLTMTQLEDVSRVRIFRSPQRTEEIYSPDQFVLYDVSAQQPEYTVTLYYPDKTNLLTPRRTGISTTDAEQLPLLALQALIGGEVPAGMNRAVPYRTQVLDVSVTDGTASVVLSAEFMSCDTSAQQAQNAVRSIAAVLCALDGIDAVQLSVIGETGMTYFDISQPVTPQADWFSE